MSQEPPVVTLSPANLMLAGTVGLMRQVKGAEKPGAYGINNVADGMSMNYIGACGEMVVAKYFGIYWDGAFGDFGARDVGTLQVRTSARPGADLILHKRDRDDDVFVLVDATRLPAVVLVGWILARHGKLEKYWRSEIARPCYFFPRGELVAVCELEATQLLAGRALPV